MKACVDGERMDVALSAFKVMSASASSSGGKQYRAVDEVIQRERERLKGATPVVEEELQATERALRFPQKFPG